MPPLLQRYKAQRELIGQLAKNRQADEAIPCLLAVSKTRPSEEIICLYQAGQRDFAENYLQEALQKQHALAHYAISWHFIGPIQSNKTRDIARYFQWAHSVDRVKIARRLAQQRPQFLPALNICLQVNVDEEANKSGFIMGQLEKEIEPILALKGIRLRGLMAIPRATSNVDEQRDAFKRLAGAKTRLNKSFGLQMDTLSMGMSADLPAAIAEGSTLLRVGTAIFGPRIKRVKS